jgi:hypothetical protein
MTIELKTDADETTTETATIFDKLQGSLTEFLDSIERTMPPTDFCHDGLDWLRELTMNDEPISIEGIMQFISVCGGG